MISIIKLVGKKIVAIKGYREKGKHDVFPSFIFFDDNETVLELDEQDYFAFHDCSSRARELNIIHDKIYYNNMFNSSALKDANVDL